MFTYEDAMNILGHKTQKKVAGNTWLVNLADSIGVRFHDTIVVYLFADGTVRYNSGGYMTVTTKRRMNQFSPYSIKQAKGQWSVWKWREVKDRSYYDIVGLYQDFFTVNPQGRRTL